MTFQGLTDNAGSLFGFSSEMQCDTKIHGEEGKN